MSARIRATEPDSIVPIARATERLRTAASVLSGPPLQPGIVDRPGLIDRLVSAISSPVVLVSAPAGYGKTSLLALWREREQRPFAWVSLEAADNDPVTFARRVLAALERILEADSETLDGLRFSEPPLESFVVRALRTACAASRRPFVLVLDDLHVLTERHCLAAIGCLAERLPPGCQLALATRTDPPLPLASWRAHGRMTELRTAQLALGASGACALLAAAGVPLEDDLVAQLNERTEGWPAGLYLAALSLRDHADPWHFVERFTGTNRYVADFLSEDVLARQPHDVIEFLLHTCVLDELTAAVCDALTGSRDSDRRLRELERCNLFLLPLDEERIAYRYHRLFAQYLRAELMRRSPELVPELHRRAWRWYRAHELAGHAVTHALGSGDLAGAAAACDCACRRMPRGSEACRWQISDAERRVLRLLASDLSLREIGRELFLSLNTVKTHKRSIYRKLGVVSRAEAVRAARREAPSGRADSPG